MLKNISKKISSILLFIVLLFNVIPAMAADDIESYNNCTGDCYDKYGFNESDYGKLAVCIETCDYTYPQGKTACSLEGSPACVRVGSSGVGSTIPAANTTCGKSFCLNIPIGNLTGFDVKAGSSIMGDYIKSWYGFLLGTVGILATVMIMWGGFKYLVSRGDKASIESAKTQMISAVTGVVLAFGTYTLLYLINPVLLTINTPNLPGIQGGENITLKQGGSGDTNIDFNKVPQTGITDYGDITDKTSAAIDSYKQKYGAIPTSTYRPGPDDDRHSSGRAVDFHLQEGSPLYNHVTTPGNWSQQPQQLSWGTAYYLNDGSVWVDEPGGSARHFHTEIPDEGWAFCPNWPCK